MRRFGCWIYCGLLLVYMASGYAEGAKIVVLCSNKIDQRELSSIPGYEFLFHQYATEELEELLAPSSSSESISVDLLHELGELDKLYRGKIDAVLSTDDYPGTILAALVASRLGLVGPAPEAVLRCQHKYFSRCRQREVVPEATPPFGLISLRSLTSGYLQGWTLPCFIKPQRATHSAGASCVRTLDEARSAIKRAQLPQSFCDPFNAVSALYSDLPPIDTRDVLVEELLEGFQATLEGFSYQGQVIFLGITDSIMFPGTLSFERFEYPSVLPEGIQQKIRAIATRCMKGFNYDNGFFNIEFIYNANKNTLSIIEINPRLVYQFADLYEKVDGTSSYQVLLDLVLGKKPSFKHGCGKYPMAASCVLRRFSDALVVALPAESDYQELATLYPDVRIDMPLEVGYRLSGDIQDTQSFFYGAINCGGKDREEIQAVFLDCKRRLPLMFQD